MLTTDAQSVLKSLLSRDLKAPAGRPFSGHVSWMPELLQIGFSEAVQKGTGTISVLQGGSALKADPECSSVELANKLVIVPVTNIKKPI